ncbi:hypothetical protein GQ457_13G022730 [Hibiscus cannabinus]
MCWIIFEWGSVGSSVDDRSTVDGSNVDDDTSEDDSSSVGSRSTVGGSNVSGDTSGDVGSNVSDTMFVNVHNHGDYGHHNQPCHESGWTRDRVRTKKSTVALLATILMKCGYHPKAHLQCRPLDHHCFRQKKGKFLIFHDLIIGTRLTHEPSNLIRDRSTAIHRQMMVNLRYVTTSCTSTIGNSEELLQSLAIMMAERWWWVRPVMSVNGVGDADIDSDEWVKDFG